MGTEVTLPSSGHNKISKLVDRTTCHWLHNAIFIQRADTGYLNMSSLDVLMVTQG